jgi:P-type Ca2+ transporter type 2C
VKDDVNVSVLRNGVTNHVSVKELVVGDIVQLNAGDKIPADGVMILGSDVICDESALTGESEGRHKEHWEAGDPFLLSGSTLSSGYCEMVVTAVGIQSRWGKIKADLNTETAETPLQEKLTVLADQIGYGGMAAAGATFIAIIAIYFLFPESRDPSKSLFDIVLKSFIMAVTIVVVAVPEGLPLAVTLSLAFSTQKMMEDNNLIRVLEACETMGNATNICSDKTGTLTENRMTVVAGWINGVEYDHCPTADEIPSEIANILSESISVNTTAHLSVSEKKQQLKPSSADGEIEVLGNKTEGALLIMLKKNWNKDYLMLRSHGLQLPRGDKLITFSSQRKCMTMIQNFPTVHKVFIKGAGEVILHKCKKFLTNNGMEQVISKKLMSELNEVILKMSRKALRVIALAHKEVASGGSPPSVEDVDHYESDLTLDGIFGIIDPLRPDVIEAVRTCQSAGVFVRMVTGDNIETAKAIATSCGILTAGGVAMEGPEFRRLTPKQLDDILPKLQVLARSSPNDKYTLVCRLNGHNLPETREDWEAMHPALSYESQKDLVLPGYLKEWEESRQGGGEVVGVTGDGTNVFFSLPSCPLLTPFS